VAIHAEANALIYCDREDLIGATLYITRQPCYAGIENVIYFEKD
jgi:dCMP deaminase